MGEKERWDYIVSLDDELLKSGVLLSEWCSFIVREADISFIHGAFLSSILISVAAIETYLRSEYSNGKKESFCELINQSSLEETLKEKLHELRRYRNKWVHVIHPENDEEIINNPNEFEKELEEKATGAIKVLRIAIYENKII